MGRFGKTRKTNRRWPSLITSFSRDVCQIQRGVVAVSNILSPDVQSSLLDMTCPKLPATDETAGSRHHGLSCSCLPDPGLLSHPRPTFEAGVGARQIHSNFWPVHPQHAVYIVRSLLSIRARLILLYTVSNYSAIGKGKKTRRSFLYSFHSLVALRFFPLRSGVGRSVR